MFVHVCSTNGNSLYSLFVALLFDILVVGTKNKLLSWTKTKKGKHKF